MNVLSVLLAAARYVQILTEATFVIAILVIKSLLTTKPVWVST